MKEIFSAKMKIGILIETLDKAMGGPPRSVPAMAKGLSQLGAVVTIVCVYTDNMNTHILNGTDVRLVTFNGFPSKKDFENCFEQEHFDVVHTQGIWNLFYCKAVRVARKMNIPYVVSPRGTLKPWAYAHHGLKKKIAMFLYERRNLSFASCILTTAESEAQHIRNLGFSNSIAVIPNGMDLSEYPCRSIEKRDEIRKEILFLSRINPQKGIDFLIGAWIKLSRQYPDWKVRIVGPFEIEEYVLKLKKQIKDLGLNDSVIIQPAVYGQEKSKLYSQASLFVLPTFTENFGMVIAEAMACGLPVITTVGAPWECLKTEDMGWWIEIGETPLLKALGEALSKGEDDLFEMGQRCSDYVRHHFDSNKVAESYFRLYKSLIDKE